jgi:hypothetical protein
MRATVQKSERNPMVADDAIAGAVSYAESENNILFVDKYNFEANFYMRCLSAAMPSIRKPIATKFRNFRRS